MAKKERDWLREGKTLWLMLRGKGRPPGNRVLIVLAEIAACHRAGKPWVTKPPGAIMGELLHNERAKSASRLVKIYSLCVGNGTQGYWLAKCPHCGLRSCHGSACQLTEQPTTRRKKRTARAALAVVEHLQPGA